MPKTSNIVRNDKDIHNIENDITRALEKIQREWTSANWELMSRYYKVLNASGISRAGIRKSLRNLSQTFSLMEFPDYKKLTKEEIDDLLMETRIKYPAKQKDSSYYNHVQDLMLFVRWVILGDREFKRVGNPEITSHIRNLQPPVRVSKNDIITVEECDLMINSTNDIQEKALISVSHEAGTRTGEILTADIRHVKFDDMGAVLRVKGKTGRRDVRLIRSAKYLHSWINSRKDADASTPLFIMTWSKFYGKRMSVSHGLAVLQRCAKLAHIEKKVTFQINRHSGATIGAGILTEAQMKIQFGWNRTSNIPARYTHLNESDVDKSFSRFYGLETREDNSLKIQKCVFCDTINGALEEKCITCLRVLDPKKVMEDIDNDKKIIEELQAENKTISAKSKKIEIDSALESQLRKILEKMLKEKGL